MTVADLADWTVTVAGTPVSIDVARDRFEVAKAVGERSTAVFTVTDPDGTLRFLRGQSVVIDDLGTNVFCGFVDESVETAIGGTGPGLVHTVSCVDCHYLADKRIVATSFEDVTAKAVVESLHATYLDPENVTLATATLAGAEVNLGGVVINYVPLSVALDRIAELAGAHWWIDDDRELHFEDPTTAAAAPFDLDGSGVLVGPTVTQGNQEYRNRQYVRGGRALTSEQVETFVGDGERTAFTVGFPIAQVPTVKVNTVAQTVGIKGVDQGKDWYWSKGDATLAQDFGGTVLTGADTLEVTYVGEYRVVGVLGDGTLVDAEQLQDGGTGLVEAVFDDPDANDLNEVFTSASGRLARYGREGWQLDAIVRDVGLKPGQLATVDLPDHSLDTVEALITDVTSYSVGTEVRHRVTVVDGPNLRGFSTMLADQLRRSSFIELLNIGENEVLVVAAGPFVDQIDLSETVTQNVYACPVPSSTTYPDASLLPC